ncbi:1-acyl-sn-glycerol-3-phosphate acyltransferase [Halocynthiibacter namhaensis]|uniref:1-acyl-sn-glycerol-3-phosphate acyltransferase n=1 Tax=Halocynthiibacter namhaensis TaxID=1290553 RepID=UPI00068A6C59|nr:1-acyl-sn-glycerol-3-phosphate acyltransferase [Halocynthiibacter namhaensis]
MFRTVELPFWALILILLFAAVTFASHFLFPSVRWFFRRRMERVVAKVNTRLDRPIEPFKLAERHDMIQRLIYDPKVAQAIVDHSREEGVPENVAFESARRYAREIVPSFSATAYFGFGTRIARWLSNRIYRVRLGHYDEAAIKAIDPNATVIFVMNHRSNMDYVLVTWLAAERSALSYAVGEWARIWPLRALIRSMGAYFIRRKSRNKLYRRVLARYVQMATEGGVTQAVFPEGGLSLDGSVQPPKLGLLSYIVNDFEPGKNRDVVFVPIAINYDRVLEDRVLIDAQKRGDRKFGFTILGVFKFIFRQIRFAFTGRFHRFGYAGVSFGNPMSLSEFMLAGNKGPEAVGNALMDRIRDVLPVLPVPLVATVLLSTSEALSEDVLSSRVATLIDQISHDEGHVHLPRNSSDYAAKVGLRMLKLRKMVVETPAGFIMAPDHEDEISFYANSIAHLVHSGGGAASQNLDEK